MFKKNQNGKQTVVAGKPEAVRSVDAVTGSTPVPQGPSWLSSAAGADPETRLRKDRLLASEVFMKTRLIPLVQNGARIDETSLVDLLVDFKRSRSGAGSDFKTPQLMGTLLNRFQCHLMDDNGDEVSEFPDLLELDVLVYSSLAELDLEAVDHAVRERYASG
jgi:hypothetical protein